MLEEFGAIRSKLVPTAADCSTRIQTADSAAPIRIAGMAVPASFQTIRDRDAWAAIRGFCFQVDLTIERWLGLGATEALELERGEDIDTCLQALTGGDASRLLEQVKQLDGNVTLRSEATLEFLASALEHRTANPSLTLNFRFVSTARPGIEKPTPLTPRGPAIVAWRDAANMDAGNAAQTITALRKILGETSRPRDFSPAAWKQFSDFVSTATNDAFHAFMTRVEWALGTGDSSAVRKRAQGLLAQRLRVTGGDTASAYRDLFFFIFDALSSSGLKRLTVRDLDRQIGSGWRERCTESVLAALEALYTGQEARLDEVEERLIAIDKILKTSDLPERFANSRALVSATLPPPVPRLVVRPAISKQLNESLDSSSLVLVRGEHGIGKTQIARIVASTRNSAWLRIRRNHHDVDNAIAEGIAFARRNNNSLLVLDSLPRLEPDSPSTDALSQLSEAPFKILATSTFQLPAQLRSNLGPLCTEIELAPFSRDEILELIGLFPLSEPLRTNQFSEFLRQLTNGHPTLIRAILAFLDGQKWTVDTKTLSNLIAGKYAQSAKADALRLFADTVRDKESRELAYRIDVARFPASRAEIEAVAQVHPVLGLPFEKLECLRGVWIQEADAERWRLSPLIAGAGALQLDTDLRIRIDFALGELLVRSRVIDISAFQRALVHFVAAGAYHRAAALYSMGVQSYRKQPVPNETPPVLSVFPSTMPQSAPASARALVLYSEIRLKDKLRRDAKTPLDQLRNLLEDQSLTLSEKLDAGLIAATLGAGAFRPATDRLSAIQFTEVALRLTERVPPELQELADASASSIDAALWVSFVGAVTLSELRAWIKLLRKVEPQRMNGSLGASPHSHEGIDLAVKVVVQRTAGRSQAEWEDLLHALDELEAYPQSFISSAATAGKLYGLGIRKELTNIEETGRAALAKHSDPSSSFVIRETLGIVLDDAGLPGAETYLVEAEALALSTFTSTRIDGLRRLARIRAATAAESAVTSEEAALGLAREADIQTSRLIRILTELAILIADARGPRHAFPYFDEAASRLFAQSQDNSEEKALFVLFGHTIGYYAGIASGVPVETTIDGSPYTKPSVSIFFNITTAAAALYQEERRAFLPSILARYAQAIGDDAAAERWGEKATVALETADAESRALLSHGALPFQLRSNAFGLAIGTAARALPTPVRVGAKEFKPERLAIASTLLPALARAATLGIRSSPLAQSAAEELANACKQRAQDSGEQLWTLAERIVRAVLIDKTETSALEQMVREALETQDPFIQGVSQFAYSLQPALDPKQVLARQLSPIMEYALGPARLSPGIHRLIISPFLATFWTRKVQEQRFLFVAPKLLEATLAEASTQPNVQAVRAIFNGVMLSLNVRPPEWARAWLSEKSSGPIS